MVHSFSEALGESGSSFVGVPVRILHVGSISESSFVISGAQNRDDCFLLEVVLSSPFKEQGSVLWQASFFAILWHIWLACSIIFLVMCKSFERIFGSWSRLMLSFECRSLAVL